MNAPTPMALATQGIAPASLKKYQGIPMKSGGEMNSTPSQCRFPNEQDQVAHPVVRAFSAFGQRRDASQTTKQLRIDEPLCGGVGHSNRRPGVDAITLRAKFG